VQVSEPSSPLFHRRLTTSLNRSDQIAATNAFLGKLRELEDVFGLLLIRRLMADREKLIEIDNQKSSRRKSSLTSRSS
jgi:hypothetical protein